MKHLITYKLFESQNFDLFRDLFQELKDEGFDISVKESTTQKLDFSELDSFSSHNLRTKDGTIKTIDVKVEKRFIDEAGQLNVGKFNIEEIKETLLFAESYAKDELGLELEYIYTMKVPIFNYYKSVSALPYNQTINSVTFSFRKTD